MNFPNLIDLSSPSGWPEPCVAFSGFTMGVSGVAWTRPSELSKRLTRPCVAFLLAFSAVPCCLSQEAREEKPRSAVVSSSIGMDGRGVLQNLVQYDSIYKSGFAVTAMQRRMDPIDLPGPFFKVQARWRLTFEGNRTGYVKEVTDRENVKYLPPDQRPWTRRGMAPSIAKEEPMFVAMRNKDWGYWGDDASGVHFEYASLKVTPDGKVTQVATIRDASLYEPTALQPIAAQYSFQWALGRFFSDRLDKITHVEQSADGRLHVSALGNRRPADNGRWELEIEPAAAWMVRKARFYRTYPTGILGDMTNEGTVWSGSFCIPKTAQVNFAGIIEDIETVQATSTQYLTFEPVVNKFDEKLYQQCQQKVLHDHEPLLTVTDYRVQPRAITVRKSPESSTTLAAGAPNPALRWVIVIVNLIAISGLSAFVVLRRKWKKANRSIGL